MHFWSSCFKKLKVLEAKFLVPLFYIFMDFSPLVIFDDVPDLIIIPNQP